MLSAANMLGGCLCTSIFSSSCLQCWDSDSVCAVDTLLSHFLDRYFPERQSGVKQCKTCATRARAPDSMLGSRSRMPCEECNLQVTRVHMYQWCLQIRAWRVCDVSQS